MTSETRANLAEHIARALFGDLWNEPHPYLLPITVISKVLEQQAELFEPSPEPRIRPGEVLSDEPTWTFTEHRGGSKAVLHLDKSQADRVKALLASLSNQNVSSSAIPSKRNPSDAEKISSLQRLVTVQDEEIKRLTRQLEEKQGGV